MALRSWFCAVSVIVSVLLTSVAAQGAIKQRGPRLAHAAANPLSVHWLAPAEGSTVTGTLSASSCQITTHDSARVAKVLFFLDGTLVHTDTHAPYSCQFDTAPLVGATHILKAKAYDVNGNVMSAYLFVTTPSTGPPPITVTVEGDSLTGGSWWRMPPFLGPSFELASVSARIGRPSVEGLAVLRHQRLGQIVVFALGTNDWWARPSAYREHLTEVLQLIGPSRCLVVPTISDTGRTTNALNGILRSLATRYGPHRLQLALWAEAVAAGRVRLPDKVHPTTQGGWQARARIVAAAVRACAAP
ncbi:MAG: Ig-like domain-containing protein [Actinomycetota bacterium]|nr:Ig-like domain-containing protein [Actinomycetota bacterium]